MIQITPQMRVLVAVQPADFRRGIDGLTELCRARLGADPFLCVERKYVTAGRKHAAKPLKACRFASGRRHIRSKDSRENSEPNPWDENGA